jgi:hypothetical protein
MKNFPVVKIEKCLKPTGLNRNEFIIDCIPLINLIKSKYNILNWSKNNYMYYEPTNTKNLTFALPSSSSTSASSSTTPSDIDKIDFSLNLYNEESKSLKFISVNVIKELTEYLDKNIIIPQTENTIPVYYLYTNKNYVIFNIFIEQYRSLFKESEKENTILNNLFQYFTDTNKFVKFSYKFNILNISLLCDKFFDIVSLFLIENLTEEKIMDYLNRIFFKYDFVKLYTLVNKYKLNLLALEKEDIRKDFVDLTNIYEKQSTESTESTVPIEPTEPTYYKKNKSRIDKIVKFEKDSKISNQEIIKELVDSIITIKIILQEINKQIPDFDKLFLMSILSYRLKEQLINGTWPFDSKYIIDYIINNFKETSLNRKLNTLKQIYTIEKPIIYENSIIINNGVEYGNCMENIILQFLKILFYNPKKENYDDKFIKSIIRPEYQEKIFYIFKNIDSLEKKPTFDLDWVIFLTKLPIQSANRFGNYTLIRGDKEIDTTFNNFILSLRYLTSIDYVESENDIYLNNIIKTTNNTYSIEIKNPKNIIIRCYREYIMNIKREHSYFESAIDDKVTSLNILSQINNSSSPTLINYLDEFKYLTYSNILNYIFLKNLNRKNEILSELLKNIDITIKEKYFESIFSESVINTKQILEYINEIIKNPETLKYLEKLNNYYWINAITYINSDFFWKSVIENKLCENWNENLLNNLNENIWIRITNYNHSEYFWMGIINNELCNDWGKILSNWNNINVWDNAIQNIKYENFWKDVIKRELFKGNVFWKIQIRYKIWNYVIQNIKSKEFWIDVINEELYKGWDDSIWDYVIRNIKSEDFWIHVIDKELYKGWGETIWDKANQYIESEYFWKSFINKGLYKSWDDNIWMNVIKNIKLEYFWKDVFDKELYKEWGNRVLIYAVANIKLKDFWDDVIKKELDNNMNNIIWNYPIVNNKSSEFWNHVIERELYKGWGDTNWNNAIEFIKLKDFWNNVIKKELDNNMNNIIWNYAIINIKLKEFWIDVIKRELYKGWNSDNWNNAIQFIKLEDFWIHVIEKELYKGWNSDNWSYANKFIKSEVFWIHVIEKELYKGWNNDNLNNAIQFIELEDFWIHVINRELYKGWNRDNWSYANKFIKSKVFWIHVIEKELYKKWNDKNWSNAILYIKLEDFWKKVIEKELYNKWDSINWTNAFRFLEFEDFWKNIIDKKLYNKFNLDNWLDIANNLKSLNFWISVIDKNIYIDWIDKTDSYGEDDDVSYDSWNELIWETIMKNFKSEDFYRYIIEKNVYKHWTNRIWNYAIENIKSEVFWRGVIEKKLYKGWKKDNWDRVEENDVLIESEEFWKAVFEYELNLGRPDWDLAIEHIKSEDFWMDVIKNKLYTSWDSDIWNSIIDNIEIENFWKSINLELVKKKIGYLEIKKKIEDKQKSLVGGRNNFFKNKYLKYKAKYLQQKNLLN